MRVDEVLQHALHGQACSQDQWGCAIMHAGIQICGSVPEQDLEGREGFSQSDPNTSWYLQEPMPGLGPAVPMTQMNPCEMGCHGATFNVQEGLEFLPQPLEMLTTHCDHMWPHLMVMATRNTSRLKESSFYHAWGTEGTGGEPG